MSEQNKVIDKIMLELIDLCSEKYRLIKIGQDTLQIDIVFIEKYENLKKLLGIDDLSNVDFNQTPNIKVLQDIIAEINNFENKKNNRNIRMSMVTKAYKK